MKELKKVELTSVYDVFNNEDIQYIKDYLLPGYEPHQCHYNSAKFAIAGVDNYDIMFVEGYIHTPYIFGHCFNKVINEEGQEFYIDLTTELVNNEDPTTMEVWVYNEWNWSEIEDCFDYYGQAFIPHIGYIDDEGNEIKVEYEDFVKEYYQ